ncbi:MAG: YHS domain-containing (seleno)protein [Planctomycetota bacterium]
MPLTAFTRSFSACLAALVLAAAAPAILAEETGEPVPPTLTDKNGLAIEGYDPVAYFPEADGKPVRGDKDLTATHHGATYRFVSEANRERFLANPDTYAPAYGGYCAFAMADGQKVTINPKSYEIHDGRLYLFYRDWFTNTLKPWKKDRDTLRPAADGHWEEILEDLKK